MIYANKQPQLCDKNAKYLHICKIFRIFAADLCYATKINQNTL